MYHAARNRLWLLVLILFVVALPAAADNVTVSGNVLFSSLDGSSLDHDGAANGTFTVSDGDLIVNGTINCNDDSGAGSASACAMKFVVSGNVVVNAGGGFYAENRRGGGAGGDTTIEAGGNVVFMGPSGSLPGAVVSTTRLTGANPDGTDRAGKITITAGGSVTLQSGTLLAAGAIDGIATEVSVTAAGPVSANGKILVGGSNTVSDSTKYTGTIISGGASQMTGGSITLKSTGNGEPGVTVGSDAIIAAQGETPGAGKVVLEGCGIVVKGLVASLSKSGSGANVIVRSGTYVILDGRDLGVAGGTRNGMLRADATLQSASSFAASIYAPEGIEIYGPASGSLYAVNSNGGNTSKDAAGTINVMSTKSTILASGNAFAAYGTNSGDQGGTINVSAKSDINLATAKFNASGDYSSSDSARKGGKINVRSYGGSVTWTNGVGDVRPVGSTSGIAAASQGSVTVTYCTSQNLAGTTFPVNGAFVGPFPTLIQSCSPAAPSLPAGEYHPDCNDPPVANNDAYTVAEGGTLTIAAPGVLGNDVDPDGDPITATLVSGPSHASSFTFNADGSFSYTHDGSETTTDSFTYKANDGSLDSNVATVTITITPVNDPPVANNDAYTVAEGGTLNYSAPGVLSNDTDPDGPAASAILVSGPAHASSFSLNADGSFLYVHDGSETTSDSFTYQVSDGSLLSNVATVSITVTPVNDAPVANDDSYSTNEDTPLTVAAPGVLGNDTDVDSGSLTVSLVSGPSHAASFSLNADGSFSYTPNADYNGPDIFVYAASDGSLTDTATVSITVNAVNDAPVASDDSYSTDEDTPLTVAAPGVLGNDTDVDNPSLTVSLVSGPSSAASFSLNADGSFSYTPNADFNGTDSFTYQVSDGSLTDTATVTITVNAVNDAPVANDQSVSTNEDNAVSFTLDASDVDSGSLSYTILTGPANGTLSGTAPNLTYTPNADFNGSDSFTYEVSDGSLTDTATVSITVNAVNDAPVANDQSVSTDEDTPLPITLSASDVDSGSLTYTVGSPAHGTLSGSAPNLTYTPNANYYGPDSFSWSVSDGSLSDSATVTITVNPVNDAPVANDQSFTTTPSTPVSFTLSATDVDGPSLSYTVGSPANGTLSGVAPNLTYTPNSGFAGTDSFTWSVSDGSLSDSATVTITVTAPPPVAGDDSYVGIGNTELRVGTGANSTPYAGVSGSLLGNDSGTGTLTVTNVDTATFATQGTVTWFPNGTFNYLPPVAATGIVDKFRYTVSDGFGGTDTADVSITITGRVWYVNSAAGAGTGRSTQPFSTLTAAQSSSFAGDVIFVHRGSYSTGITLKNNQQFIGEGILLAVGPYTLANASAGPRPSIGAVVLANANRVAGFDITPAAATIGIFGNNIASTTIESTDVVSSSTDAMTINSATGTFNLTNVGLNATNAGLTINSSAATVNLSDVDIAASTGVGLTINGGTVNASGGSSVSSASTTAINLSGSTLGMTLESVSSNGGTNGVFLNNTTGSFSVSGTGSTGTGGTIQNAAARGVNVNGATAVSLANMVISNNGAANGDVAATCGDLINGTNQNCNAGIHLINASSLALTNVQVSGGKQIGINGKNVGGIAFDNVTVSGAGDESFENGVQFVNLSGTSSVSNSSFSTNYYRQFAVINSTGTGSMTITGSTFNGTGAGVATGAQGALISTAGTANYTVNASTSTFTNNRSFAYQSDTAGTSVMNVTLNNNTFTTNNLGVSLPAGAGTTMTYAVTNNTWTGTTNAPLTLRSSGTSTGTVTGNQIGTAGVVGSGCSSLSCFGTDIGVTLTGSMAVTVSNNVIHGFQGRGISAQASSGSGTLNIAIKNNTVGTPGASPDNAIFVQSGAASADTTFVCADIASNSISGSGYLTQSIRVRNRFAGTNFRLPGYAGSGSDVTAIAAFLSGQNGGATASATVSTNPFVGGAACPTP